MRAETLGRDGRQARVGRVGQAARVTPTDVEPTGGDMSTGGAASNRAAPLFVPTPTGAQETGQAETAASPGPGATPPEASRIAHHPPDSPDHAEPGDAEPGDAEPDNAEPDNAEPDNAEPDNAEPDNAEPDNATPALLRRPVLYGWLLVVGVATVVGHVLAAGRAGAGAATLGETRLAVATAVARGAAVVADPMPLSDRFAAVQLAVLQTLLPVGGLPLVDAARWVCLAAGAGTALMVWPIARGLGIPAPAAAVGVALAGVAAPAVALHSGVSAAAVGTLWLSLAVACAVRGRGRAAALAAVLGVLTTPLAGVALFALAAHLVLNGTVRPSVRFRLPIGGGLGVAAVVVAVLAVAEGSLAGEAGAEIGTPVAVAGAVGGLLLVVLAGWAEAWLRPVFAATALLFVLALVPGSARAAALVLVVPVLAVAGSVLIEPLGDRLGAGVARLSAVLAGLLIVSLLVAVPAGPQPSPSSLLAWVTAQAPPDTPVRADGLDRAELLAAGFPAKRLRGPDDPTSEGELVIVAERPPAGLLDRGPARCTDDAVVAATARGTGGAPAVVCRTDGGGVTVAGERPARARFGAALAENPSLRLAPTAEAALRDGAVDPRLMLVLAAISGDHDVTIDGFPAVELDTPDIPLRRVVLASVDGASPVTSRALRTWFEAQQPPFVPAEVRPLGATLLVGYPVPPPGGLLPG